MIWIKKMAPILLPVFLLLAAAVAYLFPDAFDIAAGIIACIGLACMLHDAFRR